MAKHTALGFGAGALLRVLAAILAGTLLLALAYSIPTEYIEPNAERSALTVKEEGLNPSVTRHVSCVIDNWTDSTMLLEAIYPGSGNAFRDSMLACRFGSGSDIPRDVLWQYFETGEYSGTTPYPQYWHGYLVLLKPLLLVTDYAGIRVINGVVQALVTALVCLALWRKGQRRYIVPYLLCILLLIPVALAKCLQYSSCFYIFSLGSLAVILTGGGEGGNRRLLLIFLYIGIATAYFDYLTYPVAVFGIPALFYVNMTPARSPKETLKRFFAALAVWGFGYGAMWLGKFVVGSLITGENMFAAAMDHVGYWMSDANSFTVPFVLIKNLKIFSRTPAMAAALLYAAALFALLLARRKRLTGEDRAALPRLVLPYAVLGVLPFIWYIVMLNPSGVHYELFGHKALVVTAFAGLSMLTKLYELTKKPALAQS